VAKIVNGKALAAAHIGNMGNPVGKCGNAASGDFGHNPEGRRRFGPRPLSHLRLFADGQTALGALRPEAKSSPSHS
jgi:hypothetical protein